MPQKGSLPALYLAEPAFRRELEHVSQELGITGQLARRVIDEMTAVHLHAVNQATQVVTHDEPTTGELVALRNEYLARLGHFAMAADLLLIKQAQEREAVPRKEKTGLLERLDRALLGPPGSGAYELADRVTFGLFRKKR